MCSKKRFHHDINRVPGRLGTQKSGHGRPVVFINCLENADNVQLFPHSEQLAADG